MPSTTLQPSLNKPSSNNRSSIRCPITRGPSIRSAAFYLLVALLLVEMSTPVVAQYVTSTAFATRAVRGRAPLSVNSSFELRPTMTFGFTKVTITDPSGPSKADRDLVVMLYVKNLQGSSSPAYRYPVRLAEGQSKVQIEIPFTSPESYMTWDVEIYEEGRDIEDIRAQRRRNSNGVDYQAAYSGNQFGSLSIMAGLIATNADPKVESLNLKAVNEFAETQLKAQNPYAASQLGGFLGSNAMTSVADASSDWRQYFAYAAWAASVDAIAEINDKQPQVANALRTYVSAGGMLVIYNVRSNESMAIVNKLLSSDGGNAELASWKSIGKSAPAWWIIEETPVGGLDGSAKPTPSPAMGTKAETAASDDSKPLTGAGAVYDAAILTDTLLETGLGGHRDNLNNLIEAFGFEGISLNQLTEGRQRLMTSLGSDSVLQRDYARGKVTICSKPLNELLNTQIESIAQLNQDKVASTLTSKSHDGNWFWQNLILKVGKPPVLAFCFIVALFGALLGPGLLIFTGHLKRRSLMIFLVPLVSTVAVFAIFSYGILHEGFETQMRIQSVTVFNSPAQVAFSWSRQNYFSGMPPSEGLQFSKETYVRPVFGDESGFVFSQDPRRGVTGTVSVGEKQVWNDWLKPRQQQQLLVGHKVDPRSIPISTERTSDGKLRLKNLTSSKLLFVALRGSKDDYYIETDLGPNESRESKAQDLKSVALIVGKIGADFKPKIPPEMDGGSDSLLNFGNSLRYAPSYQTQANEIIRDAFSRYLTDDLELEPNEFATLVPEFNAIEVPLKGTQADNVNLVIGVEPW